MEPASERGNSQSVVTVESNAASVTVSVDVVVGDEYKPSCRTVRCALVNAAVALMLVIGNVLGIARNGRMLSVVIAEVP